MKRMKWLVVVRSGMVIAFGLCMAGISGKSVDAAMVVVPNQSFETPMSILGVADNWVPVSNTDPSDAYNPYQFGGGNQYYVGANPTTDPASGGAGYPGITSEHLAFVYQQGPGTGISQTLAATLAPGTRYTLTVDIGRRNGAQGGPFAGSQILLMAGSTIVAQSTINDGPVPGTFIQQIATLANSDSFQSLQGAPLTIQLLTTIPFTSPSQATDWDNVSLDATAVPEPTSLSFAGAAILWGLMSRKPPRRSTPRVRILDCE